VHAVPKGNGWLVKLAGTDKPSAVASNKSEAMERACGQARESRTGLLVHGRDGRIQERIIAPSC
jgi:hypothetical protein